MTIKLRQFIFWIFVVLFVIATIIAIFFAQGWRFDFGSFKVVKTGGIFIESSVPGTKIYINDRYVKSTSGILSQSSLIDGIVPKAYNVFVYKEGFYPWNKTVEVKNGLVSEIKNIILFPIEFKRVKIAELPLRTVFKFSVKNNSIEIVNNNLKTDKTYDFNGQFLLSNQYKIASSTSGIVSPDNLKRLRIDKNNLWIDYLKDVTGEPAKIAGEKDLIYESETPIEFFDWLYDSEHVIWFTNKEIAVAERDNRGGKRNTIKFYLNVSPPIFFDKINSDLYFFEISDKKMVLYKINILGK